MNREQILEQLTSALEKCGIVVELRNLGDGEIDIKSGLCETADRRMLIIDRCLPIQQKIELSIKTLESENLDDIFLPPAIREMVEPNSNP